MGIFLSLNCLSGHILCHLARGTKFNTMTLSFDEQYDSNQVLAFKQTVPMIISASRYFHIAKLTMCYVYVQEVLEFRVYYIKKLQSYIMEFAVSFTRSISNSSGPIINRLTCACWPSYRGLGPYQPAGPSLCVVRSQIWPSSIAPQTASQTPCRTSGQIPPTSAGRCTPAAAHSPEKHISQLNKSLTQQGLFSVDNKKVKISHHSEFFSTFSISFFMFSA